MFPARGPGLAAIQEAGYDDSPIDFEFRLGDGSPSLPDSVTESSEVGPGFRDSAGDFITDVNHLGESVVKTGTLVSC